MTVLRKERLTKCATCEQAVEIGAHDPPGGRHRAVRSVGGSGKRAVAIGPRGFADVDFIAVEHRAAGHVAGDGALLPTITDSNPSKTVLRRELSEAIRAAPNVLGVHNDARPRLP